MTSRQPDLRSLQVLKVGKSLEHGLGGARSAAFQ
jgi:hypothetical protein